nr:MAG TPA: hypothetical protein [Caudoviricetes sp.]
MSFAPATHFALLYMYYKYKDRNLQREIKRNQ